MKREGAARPNVSGGPVSARSDAEPLQANAGKNWDLVRPLPGPSGSLSGEVPHRSSVRGANPNAQSASSCLPQDLAHDQAPGLPSRA